MVGVVLPLLSPFRPRCRGGREASSGALLLPCFSGRPWRRGEKLEVVGLPFLLQVVLLVSSGVSALACRGGEGSGLWRWCGVGAGGLGRRRRGWKLGGGGKMALRPWSFIEVRFRCFAADGFCGLLQRVGVPSSQRTVVRRRRRRLGALGAAEDPIEFLHGGLGCFLHFYGVSL